MPIASSLMPFLLPSTTGNRMRTMNMMWTTKDQRRSRSATSALLEMIDQGVINRDSLINDLLSWLSEAEVAEFARDNGYINSDR